MEKDKGKKTFCLFAKKVKGTLSILLKVVVQSSMNFNQKLNLFKM